MLRVKKPRRTVVKIPSWGLIRATIMFARFVSIALLVRHLPILCRPRTYLTCLSCSICPTQIGDCGYLLTSWCTKALGQRFVFDFPRPHFSSVSPIWIPEVVRFEEIGAEERFRKNVPADGFSSFLSGCELPERRAENCRGTCISPGNVDSQNDWKIFL